ncbi:heavy metal-associated isoprenylated plant protein 37 [Carica papaya]|uniref:heavy metal-associated isoprenylated plant protein 37 n=1 Tax=Carica papaya TaxID=3649 RepID=UPI000B8D0D96|nr:heavy metal-associated isoprenylated plant protein 37 [Carica papaya]
MTKEEDFKLLKIQTCVLKVNIHCDGCKQKVKKLLQRIEGVYQVSIDAELQKVTVSGSVDSATLIKKLVRAGKHAEIWSQKANQIQNQKQKNNCIKDEKNKGGQKQQGLMKGLEAFKNQQKFPTFVSEEDDDYFDDDDEDEEDELQFIKAANQLGQLGLLRQQGLDASNAKKGVAPIVAAPNNNKMNNLGNANNAGKKGNSTPNLNVGVRVNPGGIDQKTMAALKMSNAHIGGGNINNGGDAKRGNDIHAMMGLAGLHANGANMGNATGSAAALGGNRNGLGGFQVQPNNGFQGPSSAAGIPNNGYVTGQYPSSVLTNMNGYNHPSAMMMNMNMQNRHVMQQQPQMMYHRSPFIPPNTGYYYNYSHAAPYSYPEHPNGNGDHSAATHMFSDENTGSCSIM